MIDERLIIDGRKKLRNAGRSLSQAMRITDKLSEEKLRELCDCEGIFETRQFINNLVDENKASLSEAESEPETQPEPSVPTKQPDTGGVDDEVL